MLRRAVVLVVSLLAGLAWTAAPATGATAAPAAPVQLVGGDVFQTGGGRCVVGYNARNPRGARFVVSAGFCGGTGGGVVPAPADSVSTPYVRGPNGTLLTVTGVGTAAVGVQACMSGPVGGFRCGLITALNQTINVGGQVISGLIRTNICVYPGETGSPLFRVVGGGLSAIGVLVGGSGSCGSGGVSWFKPVAPILSAHGLTLYTG